MKFFLLSSDLMILQNEAKSVLTLYHALMEETQWTYIFFVFSVVFCPPPPSFRNMTYICAALLHFSISCCLYKIFYLNPVGDGLPCTGPGFITIASKAIKVIVQWLLFSKHTRCSSFNSIIDKKKMVCAKAKDLKAGWKRKDFCRRVYIYNAFKDFRFCVVYYNVISFENTFIASSTQIR